MSVIRATYTNGHFVPTHPVDLPDGAEVDVYPAAGVARDEDWSNTPEAIAEWVAWLDALEPMTLTPEDEARIAAAMAERRAFDLATWQERGDKLRAMWE